MLIRIRRLAGSAVGAIFILLLALSMLQMGEVTNPLSFFRGSPVVVEVGDQSQRWDSLDLNNSAANTLGLSANAYADSGYGPLITALAVQDAWDGGALTLPRSVGAAFQEALDQQGVLFAPNGLSGALDQMEPLFNVLTALSLQSDQGDGLVPPAVHGQASAQVVQPYDFDIVRFFDNRSLIEAPDEETLQTFLSENSDLFQRPPTWAVEALILEPADLAERIEVTQDQIRQFFEGNSDQFKIPEAWELVEVNFATQLEANLFEAQLQEGTDLETAIANSTALLVNEGLRQAEAYSDEELELLSALEVGELTDPSINAGGAIIYNFFRSYQAPVDLSFTDARQDAEESLKLQLASEQLTETVTELQRTARESGLSLSDLASLEGYELKAYAGIQDPQFTPLPEPLNEVFFARLSRILEARDTPSRVSMIDGELEALFTVTVYEPQRDLILDEAREELSRAWIQLQATGATKAKASDFAETLRSGLSLEEALTQLNDPTVTTERFEGVSRLSLDNDGAETEVNFLLGLDRAALARLNGFETSELEQGILEFNPQVISPFTLSNGDIMQVDFVVGQALILATKNEATDSEPEVREALINSLADTSTRDLFSQAILSLYLEDVASTRPAQVDAAAINAQNLARQQALAAHGGGQ